MYICTVPLIKVKKKNTHCLMLFMHAFCHTLVENLLKKPGNVSIDMSNVKNLIYNIVLTYPHKKKCTVEQGELGRLCEKV